LKDLPWEFGKRRSLMRKGMGTAQQTIQIGLKEVIE
jgi:hypothetical protein